MKTLTKNTYTKQYMRFNLTQATSEEQKVNNVPKHKYGVKV